jgi:hypothetical protein
VRSGSNAKPYPGKFGVAEVGALADLLLLDRKVYKNLVGQPHPLPGADEPAPGAAAPRRVIRTPA